MAVHRSNITVVGDNAFVSCHRDGVTKARLEMVTDASFVPFLRLFTGIRQNSFIQDDSARSNRIVPQREVVVIRGNIPRGVYDLIKALKQEAEGMIHTHFDGDMAQAANWIAEEFQHRLDADPNILNTPKVWRSVLATLPIVTRTLRNDYRSALITTVDTHGLKWVRHNMFPILGLETPTFECVNRHHVTMNLLASRSLDLMNAGYGSHRGVGNAIKALGIEPITDMEFLMSVGNCDEHGVALLLENIQRIHFDPVLRKSLGVPEDPRRTFTIDLTGRDLFRESL